MKKYLTTIFLMSFTISVFSQEVIKNKEYYLAKSKRQKSGARVMLISGPVLIGAGLLIGNRKESSFDDAGTGVILGGVGVLLMLGSIPVFIASGKNNRKATSLSFKNEPVQQLKNSSLVFQPMPAVSFKINL